MRLDGQGLLVLVDPVRTDGAAWRVLDGAAPSVPVPVAGQRAQRQDTDRALPRRASSGT